MLGCIYFVLWSIIIALVEIPFARFLIIACSISSVFIVFLLYNCVVTKGWFLSSADIPFAKVMSFLVNNSCISGNPNPFVRFFIFTFFYVPFFYTIVLWWRRWFCISGYTLCKIYTFFVNNSCISENPLYKIYYCGLFYIFSIYFFALLLCYDKGVVFALADILFVKATSFFVNDSCISENPLCKIYYCCLLMSFLLFFVLLLCDDDVYCFRP